MTNTPFCKITAPSVQVALATALGLGLRIFLALRFPGERGRFRYIRGIGA